MAEIDPASAVAAAAASHVSWHAADAVAAGGSTVSLAGGSVCATPGEDGGSAELEVLFVEPGLDTGAVVDELLDYAAGLAPLRLAGWWAADAAGNATLGASLLARGFQWGWQPTWMAMDPADLAIEPIAPEGVAIREIREDVEWDAPELPNHDRASGRRFGALTRQAPATTAIFAAFAGDAVVGKIVVHVANRVAGIYSTGVVPNARRRGIGGALTAAAVRRGADLGCPIVTLNATPMGEPVYRRAGFAVAGRGQTWWLTERQVGRPRPSAAEVRLVEAIGRGEVEALDAAVRGVDLAGELRCGLTPLGVAVRMAQPGAARALVRHGARLDVVSAWDLGWPQTAARLLRDHPRLANLRTGAMGVTPLHVAVERGDEELARLVLAARPDLSIRDRRYHSDALGWATHLERPRIAELIRAAASGAD